MPDPTLRECQTDVGERIEQLENELATLRRELEHSHRLATLGVLAAGTAHEINNILTPVLAYAQLASSHPEDATLQCKAVDKVIQGVETATQITQAMLGFASNPSQSAYANIHSTLKATLDCLGRDPAKDRIELVTAIHPTACVRIRPLALQQVFMNLILNALAAMKPRGGKLTVSATERSNGHTTIDVTDTGPGIPSEIAGRLFEPFVSAARATANACTATSFKQQGGSGLGLAICRQLIEEASGTITAHSAPGTGTTFLITLPTSRAQQAKAG